MYRRPLGAKSSGLPPVSECACTRGLGARLKRCFSKLMNCLLLGEAVGAIRFSLPTNKASHEYGQNTGRCTEIDRESFFSLFERFEPALFINEDRKV